MINFDGVSFLVKRELTVMNFVNFRSAERRASQPLQPDADCQIDGLY